MILIVHFKHGQLPFRRKRVLTVGVVGKILRVAVQDGAVSDTLAPSFQQGILLGM